MNNNLRQELFAETPMLIPLSHVIENNWSYLHLTDLDALSLCVNLRMRLAQDGRFLGDPQVGKLYLSVLYKMSL